MVMNLKIIIIWALWVTVWEKNWEQTAAPFKQGDAVICCAIWKGTPDAFVMLNISLCQPFLSEKEISLQTSDIKASGIWIHSNYQSGHPAVSYKLADLASDININWINVNTCFVPRIQIVWCCPPAQLRRTEIESHGFCPGDWEAVGGLRKRLLYLFSTERDIKQSSMCTAAAHQLVVF